jgi:hypothetical protein
MRKTFLAEGEGNPMVGEVVAGLGAVKTAFDIAKGLKDIDNATARNAAVIDLQEKLLTAQAAQSALVERIRELEAEKTKLEKWEAEKGRYQLQKLPPGVFVYSLKNESAGGEPPHRLCSKCYQHNKKSILQESGNDYMKCHECGSEYYPSAGTHDYASFAREDDADWSP